MGHGPIVKVEMLVPVERGGRVYTPTGGYTPHTNTIGIPVRHVGLYEAGQDLRKAPKGFQVHLVGVILLHELTHWAREQAGLADTSDIEEGFEFEKQMYGGVIDR